MNRSKVGLVLAGFLLAAGMGSASVLDSFGIISGEASVEGPTFVVGSDNSLVLEKDFDYFEHGFPSSDLSKTELDYYSDEGLPDSDWYPMKLKYSLYAGIEGDSPDLAEVEMTLRGKDGQNSYRICTGTVQVTKNDSKELVSDTCEGGLNKSVNEFELELNVVTDGAEIQYSGNGDTKVEVNAQ